MTYLRSPLREADTEKATSPVQPPAESNPASAPVEAPKPPEAPKVVEAKPDPLKATLAELLGNVTPERLREILTTGKAAEEARKTDAEKAAAAKAEAELHRTEATALRALVDAQAKAALAGLSEAQRAAVKAVAGEDPAKVLQTVEAMRATWSKTEPPVAPAGNSAPNPSAPSPTQPTPAVDHKSKYQALEQVNPFAAAAYLAQHRRDIYPLQ